MASVTDSYSSSTSINNIMTLEIFPQEGKSPRESYGIFFDSLCDVAATFTASDPEFGLLGAVLSPAQYEIISPGRPFTELPNPGPPYLLLSLVINSCSYPNPVRVLLAKCETAKQKRTNEYN